MPPNPYQLQAPMNLRHLCLLGAAALAFAGSARAQTTTGTVRGHITDPQGAPVAEARIVARDARTGLQTQTTSQKNGFYVLAGLNPATYEITVRLIGSAPQAKRLDLLIGQSLTLDFQLVASAVQ